MCGGASTITYFVFPGCHFVLKAEKFGFLALISAKGRNPSTHSTLPIGMNAFSFHLFYSFLNGIQELMQLILFSIEISKIKALQTLHWYMHLKPQYQSLGRAPE